MQVIGTCDAPDDAPPHTHQVLTHLVGSSNGYFEPCLPMWWWTALPSAYLCGGGERGACIDLNQPGLEGLVDDDVVAVQLKAVLVVDHDGLHVCGGGH